MKKLLLKLTKNNKVELEKELDYFINDNKINFKDEDTLYKINLDEKIFMKKDHEYYIKIDLKNNITSIKLLKENLDFSININKSRFINRKNNLIIEYVLDDGENINNIINIKY